MTIENGGPAFPQHGWSNDAAVIERMSKASGMSLRDWFAGQALIALTAGRPIMDDESQWCNPLLADDAYKLADAMLAARNQSAATN